MSSFEADPSRSPDPIASALASASGPRILFGPLGLRAGWGILIFFILAVLLGSGLFFGLAKSTGQLPSLKAEQQAARALAKRTQEQHLPKQSPLLKLPIAYDLETPQTGGVLLAALGLSFLERRRFRVYGLPARRLRDLAPGALWGLAAISLLIGLLWISHGLFFDAQLLHGTAILRFGLAWLVLFLLVGTFEEFLFRGYIQFTLMRGLLGLTRRLSPEHERLIAFWLSALLWSTLFFVVHMTNAGETPAGLAGVFVAGLLFSYALWRTGSLWWGIGFHMTWDWGQSFLFGVPDSGTLSVGRLFATHPQGNPLLSGGVDGPEGSLLIVPVLLLMFLVLRLHPHAEQPSVEQGPEPPSTAVLAAPMA